MIDEKNTRQAPPREKKTKAVGKTDPKTFTRTINEDDDGYDPYSDRQESRSLFERDPWN